MRTNFEIDNEDVLGVGNDDRPQLTDENGETISRFPFYKPDTALVQAINVSLTLNRPLLVSGDPGSGKTSLGYAIARKLGIPRLYFFSVKSNSEGQSLFYRYDTLRRFHDAQIGKSLSDSVQVAKGPEHYLTYQALGRSILDAHPVENIQKFIKLGYAHPGKPQRSVVIIDEIDKAPRDFPNDLLDELDRLYFSVPELDTDKWRAETPKWEDFEGQPPLRPVIIVTSNSEKQLPDAFLRRCIFHHMSFPTEKTLEEIAIHLLADSSSSSEKAIQAIQYFMEARQRAAEHRPGTAEFLDLFQAAIAEEKRTADNFEMVLEKCYSAICKTKEDADRINKKT